MLWQQWLGYNLYKKLYSLIGGRPWTFIRRDIWHRFEIVNIVFFVSIGFFSGIFYPEIMAWVTSKWYHPIILVSGFYLVGVLQGHFYWGKKYIPGQQGG